MTERLPGSEAVTVGELKRFVAKIDRLMDQEVLASRTETLYIDVAKTLRRMGLTPLLDWEYLPVVTAEFPLEGHILSIQRTSEFVRQPSVDLFLAKLPSQNGDFPEVTMFVCIQRQALEGAHDDVVESNLAWLGVEAEPAELGDDGAGEVVTQKLDRQTLKRFEQIIEPLFEGR